MKLSRLASLASFFIPINLYFIGNFLGTGLQTPFLRIQDTPVGLQTMFIWREVELVLNGTIEGQTALSILVWMGGGLLLVAAAILILSNRRTERIGVITYGMGCVLFVSSTMLQYGPFFNGPAGVAIPIGLPLLAVIGCLLWKDVIARSAEEHGDGLLGPDDASVAAPSSASGSAEATADE